MHDAGPKRVVVPRLIRCHIAVLPMAEVPTTFEPTGLNCRERATFEVSCQSQLSELYGTSSVVRQISAKYRQPSHVSRPRSIHEPVDPDAHQSSIQHS